MTLSKFIASSIILDAEISHIKNPAARPIKHHRTHHARVQEERAAGLQALEDLIVLTEALLSD